MKNMTLDQMLQQDKKPTGPKQIIRKGGGRRSKDRHFKRSRSKDSPKRNRTPPRGGNHAERRDRKHHDESQRTRSPRKNYYPKGDGKDRNRRPEGGNKGGPPKIRQLRDEI